MAAQELNAIARSIVADHKGILAADRQAGTIKKRFDSIRTKSTEEAPRRTGTSSSRHRATRTTSAR